MTKYFVILHGSPSDMIRDFLFNVLTENIEY